jgi:hypothetical protein
MEPKPLDQHTANEPRGESRIDARVEAPLVAPPRFETPSPGRHDTPIVETPSAAASRASDRVAGTRLVLATMVVAAVASVALEYQGWQIAFRASNAVTGWSGIPSGGFLRGVVDNFAGALGLGAVASIAATLSPSSWKRPWRAIGAGFAFGAAAFLLALAWVSSLAP